MSMKPSPLGIPVQREGSGTAWLPDASPMHAIHSMSGSWELMLHGNAFMQYVHESSDRGSSQFGLVNWFMGMGSRSIGSSRLSLRGMFSTEGITVGKCGYPDVLATGEFCNGEPLHDRQHPHDLFMELAAHYLRPLGKNLALELYGGPVGEPALGPVAFPHRISAMPGPLAPIGHHWQDATHISFGVATAGVYSRRWKLEGSVFNGREPDEDRFDFDFGALDSYSGRVWFLPSDRWSLQASAGRLTEAEAPREAGEGRADVSRATASATYHRSFGALATSASTLAWGQNRAHGLSTDAFLVESNVAFDERNVLFGRGELARKSGEDLVIEADAPALADRIFTVGKLSVGYVRQFGGGGALLPGIGMQLSLNVVPSDLEQFYGSRTPLGLAIFASLRPRAMRMEPMLMAEGGHGTGKDTLTHQVPAVHGDSSGGHAGHEPAAVADSVAARETIEFVTLLLSDPKIEARIHADPKLHRLWSDPELQRCLTTLRRLRESGQPLPGACPAAPTGHKRPPR